MPGLRRGQGRFRHAGVGSRLRGGLPPVRDNETMDPIAIVGSGLAGYTVAREFRKRDSNTPLLMVTHDDGDFYSKPMLSNAFAQGKAPAQLVTTPGDAMAGQLNMTLLKRTRVLRIDTQAWRIETTRGDYGYGQLLLALGADTIRLPLGGNAAQDVLSVNDLADYTRFRRAVKDARSVAIIGAGLIGCEFANDLAAAGYAVTVIDPTGYPLASLLPEAAGRSLLEPLAGGAVALRPLGGGGGSSRRWLPADAG